MAALAVASNANALELISNGDFEDGELSIWKSYTTANGTLGPEPYPLVVLYDVTGSGATHAVEFQAGKASETIGPEGGGISQFISANAGLLTSTADFAAFSSANNPAGGRFSVLLDGVTMDSFATGLIFAGVIVRGSLAFSTTVTEGAHLLSLQVTRPLLSGALFGGTPSQYFDNASAIQADSVVPEPATWGLMVAGFGLAGGVLRRRARRGVAFVES